MAGLLIVRPSFDRGQRQTRQLCGRRCGPRESRQGGVVGVRQGVPVALGGSPAGVAQSFADDLRSAPPAGTHDACACRASRTRTRRSTPAARIAVSQTCVRNQSRGRCAFTEPAAEPGEFALGAPVNPARASRASRRTRSRISSEIGGRPVVAGEVQCRLISRRCQASSVPGVTIRWLRSQADGPRASADRIARSAHSVAGRSGAAAVPVRWW